MKPQPPIYLFSKTPFIDERVVYVPILETSFYDVDIDFSFYDLIVATSKQIFSALESISPAWRDIEVLAISEPTEDEALRFGAQVIDRVGGYGVELRQKIKEQFAKRKILYPRAKIVATTFADDLRAEGVNIEDIIIYETSCHVDLEDIQLDQRATLIFTSPSSVECFKKRYHFNEQQNIVAIGTTTKKALPAHLKVHVSSIQSIKASVELAKTL